VAEIDLQAFIGGALKLREPFWIASSHFTEKESILRQWREHKPAALTLKTCTNLDGQEEKRPIRKKTLEIAPRFGRSYYCDGPKSIELHSYEQTAELLGIAKEMMPESLIGISVLARDGEDFGYLRSKCPTADFCELNLKYSMRTSATGQDYFFAAGENWSKHFN
jgi:hypothetical protein